jgi:nucleotide-binding universal stress UspA family protein
VTTRPIVVGVDGSEESLRAVEWAAREAHRHGAPLRLVSAPSVPPRMLASDPAPQGVAKVLGSVPRRALAEAITRAGEVAQDLLVDTDLLTGPPALMVTGSGSGALMLVVGARGTGGFAAMLLGSVSRYAAMHASCPVVVVREETSVVHREVAVGIRDPYDATATLPFAFEEAALRGATLVAVRACHWSPAPAGIPGSTETMHRPVDPAKVPADTVDHLTETLRSWQEKYPAVPVREDVVSGHPGRVLASYTARADLVVIGRHGGHDTGPAIGAVQHAVLNHAHGPVAVVPARAADGGLDRRSPW